MQTIVHNGPVNLNLLHEQLMALVPTFQRTTLGPQGIAEAAPDCGRVSGGPAQAIVEFADNIPAAQVQAVITAHNAAGQSAGQAQEAARAAARAALIAFNPATIADLNTRAFITNLKRVLGL